MQQFWLRQQNELVKKTTSNDDQTQSVNSLKKQLLILEQKKMRTDGKQVPSNIYSRTVACSHLRMDYTPTVRCRSVQDLYH